MGTQIQIEAHLKAGAELAGSAGKDMSLSAGIVVPPSPGFAPVQAKPTLKIGSMDVTSKPKVG